MMSRYSYMHSCCRSPCDCTDELLGRAEGGQVPKLSEREEEKVFKILTLFFAGKKVADILTALRPEFPDLTRETIYPRLAKAYGLGLVKLVPPVEQVLADRIKTKFPKCRGTDIQVVKTQGRTYNEAVSVTAANVALDLLCELGAKGYPRVAIGLGPGKASLDFVRSLSAQVDDTPGVPELDLCAITAGCIPTLPEYAPLSFFNLFSDNRVRDRLALFAETLVPVNDFPQITTRVGVREAFKAKPDIRLVVTALGDTDDEHDLLVRLMRASGRDIKKRGAVGNVQYRPFTRIGALRERPEDLRAVTLFELSDLAEMCQQKDRHVLLIARQCGMCGMNRANVLQPLLERDELRVFSHLVMDLSTANALLMCPQERQRAALSASD
jgi:hypothetical protein